MGTVLGASGKSYLAAEKLDSQEPICFGKTPPFTLLFRPFISPLSLNPFSLRFSRTGKI